jgi:hypothetical protein
VGVSGRSAAVRLVMVESGPVPMKFMARTLKLYAFPAVSTAVGEKTVWFEEDPRLTKEPPEPWSQRT